MENGAQNGNIEERVEQEVTPEQREQYEQMMQERQAKMEEIGDVLERNNFRFKFEGSGREFLQYLDFSQALLNQAYKYLKRVEMGDKWFKVWLKLKDSDGKKFLMGREHPLNGLSVTQLYTQALNGDPRKVRINYHEGLGTKLRKLFGGDRAGVQEVYLNRNDRVKIDYQPSEIFVRSKGPELPILVSTVATQAHDGYLQQQTAEAQAEPNN